MQYKIEKSLDDYAYLIPDGWLGGFCEEERMQDLIKQFIDYTIHSINNSFTAKDENINKYVRLGDGVIFNILQTKIKFNTLRIYYDLQLDKGALYILGFDESEVRGEFEFLRGMIRGYHDSICETAYKLLQNEN